MTQQPMQGPAVKPGPNVYTVLLFIAIVAVAVAIYVVLNNLSTYGISAGDVFGPLPKIPTQ